jgi:hypothetical protein
MLCEGLFVKPHQLLLAAAGLVVAAAVVIVIVLLNQDSAPVAVALPTTTTAAPPQCQLEPSLDFKTNDEMRQALPRLSADARVRDVRGETQQEAYERFKVIFKDQPDLVAVARPEALPASVYFKPADSVGKDQLLSDLKTAYPNSTPRDPCVYPSRTATPLTR